VGYHELYVNGQRVGTRVLSPAVSNLSKRAFYVTYDIADKLVKGDNVIAVWAGPGWARSDGSYGKGVWKQDSVFKCQVNFSKGESLHSDESWKCKVSSSENLGLWKGGGKGEYGGELIDARRMVKGWDEASFDDSGWANASIYQKSLILSAEMIEPDRKVKILTPVSIAEHEGNYTFDMGRNFTGWLELKLRNGKEGEVVKLTTANRLGLVVEYNQESHYIHDASGVGTFCHRFNYTAGRWITVSGLSYKPELSDLVGYQITNDRKRTGSFECSKDLFNRIYETDLWTYLSCTVNGVTMDCPHRERFGYGEVALACSWGCAIPNFESAPYYRKVARDWFDVQREDGFVNTIAPQVYKGAGGTLWSSAPVTMSWEYYKAYGDKRQLEEAYGPMKKWLDYLNLHVSEDGIITAYESAARFLGDWATPHGSEYGNKPEAQLFNNCVYAYGLDVIVQAAKALGKADDVKIYSERLAKLRPAVHKFFYHPETHNYIDGRQLSMAFPLYTGITPESERAAVYAGFVDEISKRKPYLDTGSSGLPILLKYMVEDAERADLLFTCLSRTEKPSYGYFLGMGETAWPEYWENDEKIESRIHTCYTGIAGYFVKAIGGIRPDSSGWGMKKFIIKPQLVGDLTFARTTSGSYYGTMGSAWKRDGSSASFDIEVPINTTARVYLPAKNLADVQEGGKPLAEAQGVHVIGLESGCVILDVDSGVYAFKAEMK
jgi:alpha-L-rhamnosidase